MRGFLSNEWWDTIRTPKRGYGVPKYWLWATLGAAGLVIHAGTAVLRLSTFFPTPKLLDFAGFYASAWALRLDSSPYYLPSEFLQWLQTEQAIPFTPPVIFNPPFWPWLLQPLAWFSYPVAASIWLVLNLALLVCITIALADMAGYRRLTTRLLIFFLVLTFGPVFLDLTLGQTSVVLLAAALAIGRSLARHQSNRTATAPRLGREPTQGNWKSAPAWGIAIASGLAVGAKLFPLTWLGALPFLRRWRECILAVLMVVVFFGLGFSEVSLYHTREYGAYLLTERLATSLEGTSVDDQALIAWLDRLARPQTFSVSGFGVEQRTTVVWSPPWTVDVRGVRWVGYILLALLLLPCLFVLLRVAPKQQDAAFYLWVLYGLVALLHIERYNHVLLLPAMAWLWSRGKWQRKVVVVAYALVGLSRLTHLWAMLLPAPWGPLASGFGMYAVFLLGAAVVVSVWPSPNRGYGCGAPTNWVSPVVTGPSSKVAPSVAPRVR